MMSRCLQDDDNVDDLMVLLWLVLADLLLLQCTHNFMSAKIKGGRVEIGVIELSCLQ